MDAYIEPILSPLRPHLQPLTKSLPKPLHDVGVSLLGPVCYKKLLLDIEAEPECTKLAISKALGIGIIGASAVVKLPQLMKLIQSRSAEGLSFSSYLLETISFAITLAYGSRSGFPFSTYGESALIAAQNVAIAACILHFSGQSAGAAVFVAGIASAGYALFDERIVNMDAMGTLMAASGVLAVGSKLPQIWTIFQNGGTGQLSAFAVFNYLMGSISRIFTTLQEVDDPIVLYGYVAGLVLNAILAGQVIYYWNAPTTKKAPKKSSKKGSSAPKATPSKGETTGAKAKGPSTRRRG